MVCCRYLNPARKNQERIAKKLRKKSEELNWSGISFPVKLKDIDKFESKNKLFINVVGYDNENFSH